MPRGATKTTTTDDEVTGPLRGGGTYERVTVNLTEKSSHSLDDAVRITGDSRTDNINKGLILFGLLQRIQDQGGAIYIRERDGAELERLRLL